MAHSILAWYDEELVDKVEIRQGGKRVERFPGYETEEDVKRRLRDMGQTGTFEIIGIDPSGRPLPDKGELVVNAAARPLANLLGSTRHTRAPRSAGGLDQGMFLEHERDRQRAMEDARRETEARIDEERRRLDAEKQRALEEQRRATEEAAAAKEAALREAAEMRERAAREAVEARERAAKEAIEAQKTSAKEQLSAKDALAQQILNMAEEKLNAKDTLAQHLLRAADEKAVLAANSAQMVMTQTKDLYAQQLDAIRAQTEAQLAAMSKVFGSSSAQITEQAARNENMLVAAFSGQINQASAEVAMWRSRCERIEQDMVRRERELEEKYDLRSENVRQECERKISEIRAQANMLVSQAEDRAKRAIDDMAARVERKEAEHAMERGNLMDRVENMRSDLERARAEVAEMRMMVMKVRIQSETGDKSSRRVSEMREMVAIAKEAGADPAKIVQAEFGIESGEDAENSSMLDGIMSAVLSTAMGRRGQAPSGAPGLPAPVIPAGRLETEPI